MAAAALLRSVASKMARASPTRHRPLLARGVHGAAASGPGGSLPPPPANDEQSRGVVAVAAASGFRSLANKLARAPPPHHRLLYERGLHSRASSNSSKALGVDSSEFPRGTTTLSKSRASGASVAYIALFGTFVYFYGWVKPAMKKLVDQVNDLSRERANLVDGIQAIEHDCECMLVLVDDVLAHVSEAQSMESSGHGKESGGATEKGTRVNKLEEEVAKVQCQENRLKELQAAIKDLQAELTDLEIALELAPSE